MNVGNNAPPLPPPFIPDPEEESQLEVQRQNVAIFNMLRGCGDYSGDIKMQHNNCYEATATVMKS